MKGIGRMVAFCYARPAMDEPIAARRRFVRHPIQVPLPVRPPGGAEPFLSHVGDISEGGVSFTSPVEMNRGATLEIELPIHRSRFTLTGSVARCAPLPDGTYRIGLEFVEPSTAFKMKLAEQVLRIENLRKLLSKERGVEVSSNEASAIWVEKYASIFADLMPH
jgi:hypothetical protein